jgi:hypothetical protein
VADAVELALHVIGLADIAVRLGAEVELDAGGEEPLQRHLVDLQRRLAAIHRTGEMPWRVEMRAIVRGDRHTLDRRAFAVRQLLDLEAGEYLRELLGAFAVIDVLDTRQHVRRIRSNAGFEGDGKIDDPHRGPPGRFDDRAKAALAAVTNQGTVLCVAAEAGVNARRRRAGSRGASLADPAGSR